MRKPSVALLFLVVVGLVAGGCGQPMTGVGADWKAPSLSSAAAPLPRLAQPLVLDGDVKEWSGAACIPVHSAGQITVQRPPHEWKGPADAGMEVYAAWNADGLCLAAVVADDDVINKRDASALHQQDCVEFYLDGRTDGQFLKAPYSPGAYQIFVRPPTDERETAAFVNGRDGKIEGLKAAGKKTPTGYTVEVLIPWSAAKGLEAKPGAQVGLQFELDDYDARDEKMDQPLKLVCGGERGVASNPAKFVRWVLVDKLPTGGDAALGPRVSLDVPAVIIGSGTAEITFEAGRLLAPAAQSVRLTATNSGGKTVWERIVKPTAMAAPWAESATVGIGWPTTDDVSDGYYRLRAVVANDKGATVGTAERAVLVMRQAFGDVKSRIADAKIGELSQTRPFVAAAYLPAGVAAERVKRSATLGDQKRAIESLREAAARLDILKTGRMAWTDPGLLALLPLAADPDAQVSIQFASGSRCGLVFYCGAVPFITAEVARMASDAKARESLDPKPDEPFAMPREKIKIDGMEARRGRLPYDTEIMDRLNIDVQRQVLLVQPAKKRVLVLDLGQISCVQAQAYTYMPGCPDGIRTTVKQWASTTHLSESTLEEALKKDRVLMAGDVNVAGIAEWFKGMKFYKVKPVDQAEELIVAWGDRVIHLWCPSRKAAEDVVRLIVARVPVTPAKADALREQLVRDTMPATIVKADMPQGTHLYAGDFHMHTYYSDGQPSPAALALQAIGGAYMDFAALSDHNTLSGAKEAKRLLTAGGLAFPLMTGLEITTKWAHFNAYPVKELIPWDAKAGDVDGLIAAAHAQGAVIQWNHPGFPGSPWEIEQIPTALDRVGADAWEHVPTEYDRWKQLKACPLLVGTTDTHNGTFTPAECTIILAASPQGPAVVEAIQNRLAVAVLPFYAKIFYGPDPVVALAWSALADGKGLRAAKAGELKKVLKKADLPVILREAPSKPVAKMGTW